MLRFLSVMLMLASLSVQGQKATTVRYLTLGNFPTLQLENIDLPGANMLMICDRLGKHDTCHAIGDINIPHSSFGLVKECGSTYRLDAKGTLTSIRITTRTKETSAQLVEQAKLQFGDPKVVYEKKNKLWYEWDKRDAVPGYKAVLLVDKGLTRGGLTVE